ncbi:MAG: SUMF1/EgtB/PvdO family nonheme iron enzyme [Mucinivorans sp.]
MKRLYLLFFFVCCCLAPESIEAKNHTSDIIERLKWVNPQALKLAIEDMATQPKFNKREAQENLQYIITHIDGLQQRLHGPDSLKAMAEAEILLCKQRAITLANPLLDMDKIVVTRFGLGAKDRVATASAMCMPMSNYMGLMDVPRTGYNAEICELSQLRSPTPQRRTIFHPANGEGIADVQMHWDGDRMLFASSQAEVIDDFYNHATYSWRIYEIGLDGKGLKLISNLNERDLEYADPCYLPDGKILFTTNIGYNGIPCENGKRTIMNLAIYDPAKSSMRKITFDQDGNWSPTVLSNGRIMYTRWEYTDLTHYYSRIIMHSNPDGTEVRALYGSGSYWPSSMYDMQQLPKAGSKFIGVVTGHHGIPRSGKLIIFDPAKSRKEEKGVVQEIPFRNRKVEPLMKDRLVDGVWPQFTRPYPLSDKYFVVGSKPYPGALWGVYLVDVFDNMTLIAQSDGDGYITPIPATKRPLPAIIPDRVDVGNKEATVFIQDLYTGEGLRGVPRGTVKKLRVIAYEYAYIESPSDHDAQGIQSGWDIKRELGTVDVEEDGSAIFTVPANTPISLQPLDQKGNAIQWMRSWFTAMPGEVVSCVGCHEDQNMIPIPQRVSASQKRPSPIAPPKGGVRPFNFINEIQPILDRYCISCHTGQDGVMDLRGLEVKNYDRAWPYKMHRPFKTSYLNLHPYLYRQGPEADMYVLRPYEYHASNSELIQVLSKGHHNVKLAEEDMQQLSKWIDLNAPYFGSFEIVGNFKDIYPQYSRRQQLLQKYGNVSVDWRGETERYAQSLKEQGAIQTITPETEQVVKVDYKAINSWCFNPTVAQQMQNKSATDSSRTVEIAPGVSMRFVWIPKGSYTKCEELGGNAAAVKYEKQTIKKGFWMGQMEVSNSQFCALYPDHDSRFIGQQWKDHTTPGYPANLPEQPVIRVSWEQAMEFCKTLSQKTGLKITLPTDTQWEWSCRAGSSTDMWYGDKTVDYSKYENLADLKIKDLAVWGIDPQPMEEGLYLREFWDFVPRDTFANDGSLISVACGKYLPNPWGLYDMHGNVAEWTLSQRTTTDHEATPEKVVCGGSWRDRAARAGSSYHRYYKAWQAPFNVGFRVIIEQ